MKREKVTIYPDNKIVEAYRYAPTCLLITAGKAQDTDQSIITDKAGMRYKRRISCDNAWSIAWEYYQI